MATQTVPFHGETTASVVDTITLPRALLEQIRQAFGTAVDATVAIQELCLQLWRLDGGSGAAFAIEACLSKQEVLVCDAIEELSRLLSGAVVSGLQEDDETGNLERIVHGQTRAGSGAAHG